MELSAGRQFAQPSAPRQPDLQPLSSCLANACCALAAQLPALEADLVLVQRNWLHQLRTSLWLSQCKTVLAEYSFHHDPAVKKPPIHAQVFRLSVQASATTRSPAVAAAGGAMPLGFPSPNAHVARL